ncbi:glycine zipper 2TM domain-containing protein [Novosphingobium piscinae]|uniref:17 kDa surface antigen n=1 Tax=Novosphingobium piscinae TaxID=1507448 RepID=A0A7X1G153_9SPHN|nr:glycine zipper 2TM domain-containing protein [Novosphingobium piscinae]MBC2670067.1 glycine zipper 2TM domain-containing protein [Novosphingobium piscinae]
MRCRIAPTHVTLARIAVAAAVTIAAPARAHGPEHGPAAPVMVSPGHWGGPFGAMYGGWAPQMVINVPTAPPPQAWSGAAPGYAPGGYEGATLDRESWLRECRRRLGDNGVGGAVIGGVLGGVAGNVIGGRGNRVLGTVAGAAVGAVAGAVVDKAEDKGRVQDRCEAMLAQPAPGPGGPAMAYGYAVPVMWVPVMMMPQPAAAGATKRTVVTEVRYETVGRSHRAIPRRAAPDKRVRLVPDKRVPQ